MKRRTLFPILGAGFASAQPAYTPRFFNAGQYGSLNALADTLLPDDDDAPGAVQAQVPWFIDTNLFYTASLLRQTWTDGLRTLDEEALRSFGKPFVNLPPGQRIGILERLAQNETKPQTEGERFFVFAKRQVLEAWALSEPGMRRGLRYKGNVAVPEFRVPD